MEKLGENSNIDLVLMDIMMPEMDGYEKCIEAGANDYLAKPVDLEKLISLMRVWLPRH
jgi:CheY-like chemotaxis protein